MTAPDRRHLSSMALAVGNAVWLLRTEGTTSAIDYMRQNGVPLEVALRVVGGPEFQRHYLDRRKTSR